ncbi:uncharacterized protein G2W53_001509 [Senna tora]|uniref:Uncharacterized protein n=1 Tax=Senna tora TaxID=362788 RepID=A0A835CJH8_9FABA|nr:uncharacterized protein G2W53_001509 [Senna tora]
MRTKFLDTSRTIIEPGVTQPYPSPRLLSTLENDIATKVSPSPSSKLKLSPSKLLLISLEEESSHHMGLGNAFPNQTEPKVNLNFAVVCFVACRLLGVEVPMRPND